MFNSHEDAIEFRDEVVQELDAVDTDGWHVSPSLEGATVRIGTGVGRVCGHLDARGYRVRERENNSEEGWEATLVVLPP